MVLLEAVFAASTALDMVIAVGAEMWRWMCSVRGEEGEEGREGGVEGVFGLVLGVRGGPALGRYSMSSVFVFAGIRSQHSFLQYYSDPQPLDRNSETRKQSPAATRDRNPMGSAGGRNNVR